MAVKINTSIHSPPSLEFCAPNAIVTLSEGRTMSQHRQMVRQVWWRKQRMHARSMKLRMTRRWKHHRHALWTRGTCGGNMGQGGYRG